MAFCDVYIALVLWKRLGLGDALERAGKLQRLAGEIGDKTRLGRSFRIQALIHLCQGNLARALTLLSEQEQSCHPLGDRDELQESLGY